MVIADSWLLYRNKNGLSAYRQTTERWSNGDDNHVNLSVKNHFNFSIHAIVIDEIPFQFQLRKWQRMMELNVGEERIIQYSLRPVERGVYQFGNTNIIISSPLQFVNRKFIFNSASDVKVYPSYIQLKRFSLQAIASETERSGGSRRLRKLGNSFEFEQIKEYVRGDDIRTINWKASARKNDLMVNSFVDERSQQVYFLIDKSRHMKMPFDGLSLLDYAINATLVLSNVVLHKHDRAGVISFEKKIDAFIAAEKKAGQMELIMEKLYQQSTSFRDADYELLYSTVRYKIKQRSVLMLFANFETMAGLERQLPYLVSLNTHHLLFVVLFKNTELNQLLDAKAHTTEDIYIQTIAEKMIFEKKQMIKALHQRGISAMLTTPQELTVNAVNKYLEIKTRQMV